MTTGCAWDRECRLLEAALDVDERVLERVLADQHHRIGGHAVRRRSARRRPCRRRFGRLPDAGRSPSKRTRPSILPTVDGSGLAGRPARSGAAGGDPPHESVVSATIIGTTQPGARIPSLSHPRREPIGPPWSHSPAEGDVRRTLRLTMVAGSGVGSAGRRRPAGFRPDGTGRLLCRPPAARRRARHPAGMDPGRTRRGRVRRLPFTAPEARDRGDRDDGGHAIRLQPRSSSRATPIRTGSRRSTSIRSARSGPWSRGSSATTNGSIPFSRLASPPTSIDLVVRTPEQFFPGDPRSGSTPLRLAETRTEESTTTRVRGVIGGGAKAYFSERAFVRTDVRLTFDQHRLNLAFRGGVGIDF